MSGLLEELKWRGLVAHSTDEEALAEVLDGAPITFYVGFDPTAPSIHMGNLVQMMMARALQRAGHRPLLLVGGSTGLVGDPKESGERAMNDRTTVAGWVDRIRAQVSGLISFDGDNAAEIVNNLDWTAPLSTIDFLRDIGKHFPVNRMLDREIVARRLEAGISYTEFSYVLLQAMDYLHLFRTRECVLETGGSDQWGNITAGVELIRRAESARVHALATPLLTKADGTKYGKTESGTLWLSPDLTSPYAFHQFFLNVDDAGVSKLLRVFSERPREELVEIEARSAAEPHLRIAQRVLADDITDLVHGREAREGATAAAAALFGRGDLAALSAETLAGVFAEVGGGALSGSGPASMIDALVASTVVPTRAAAKRAIQEGGAYLNNEKITDGERLLTAGDMLAGGFSVLRRGRKTIGLVRLETPKETSP